MICPKCEYEYVDNVSTCPDCGVELVSNEDFEGHLVHHSDWVVVYSTGTEYEANMLKSNLEGADIESTVLKQSDRNFPTQGDLSVVKLLVKKTDANEATLIINDIIEKNDTENSE